MGYAARLSDHTAEMRAPLPVHASRDIMLVALKVCWDDACVMYTHPVNVVGFYFHIDYFYRNKYELYIYESSDRIDGVNNAANFIWVKKKKSFWIFQ